eukprot:TRINITY_DN3932_c0_g1_i1.p1 TRINITY_DN3932_c0_g1~~TRINITY_DN3932_c0_g1_i1.p1  ORF type:complete len:712 (-),score=245.36 TRINITY_DN3932_c0_g1_i1:95-2230(-)
MKVPSTRRQPQGFQPFQLAAAAVSLANVGEAVSLHAKNSIFNARSLRSVHTGPQNCVAFSRSSAGTCVIETNCQGRDISQVEFAFDCEATDGDIVRHSFGKGGFDVDELFDTEVPCARCLVPTESLGFAAQAAQQTASQQRQEQGRPIGAAAPKATEGDLAAVKAEVAASRRELQDLVSKATAAKAPAAASQAAEPMHMVNVAKAQQKIGAQQKKQKAAAAHHARHTAGRQATQQPGETVTVSTSDGVSVEDTFGGGGAGGGSPLQAKAVQYGPAKCVSTYKSADGHCVMQTNCAGVDTTGYEYGLVCVGEDGSFVRHLFGKDSFDPVEDFNTLIKCDACLGLEDIESGPALEKRLDDLATEVKDMGVTIQSLTANVQKLNEKVFTPPRAVPPPPVMIPPPAAAPPAVPAPPPPAASLLAATDNVRVVREGSFRHRKAARSQQQKHQQRAVREAAKTARVMQSAATGAGHQARHKLRGGHKRSQEARQRHRHSRAAEAAVDDQDELADQLAEQEQAQEGQKQQQRGRREVDDQDTHLEDEEAQQEPQDQSADQQTAQQSEDEQQQQEQEESQEEQGQAQQQEAAQDEEEEQQTDEHAKHSSAQQKEQADGEQQQEEEDEEAAAAAADAAPVEPASTTEAPPQPVVAAAAAGTDAAAQASEEEEESGAEESKEGKQGQQSDAEKTEEAVSTDADSEDSSADSAADAAPGEEG